MIDLPALATKPTLIGTLVELQPLGPQHAAGLHASTRDPQHRRLTGSHRDFTLGDIQRWSDTRAEQRDRLDLAVIRCDDGVFVGDTALTDLDVDNESMDFRIAMASPALTGRGYGTEAILLVLGYAFEVVRLHRVQLEVYAFNERARRLYERCGFVAEGVRRDALRWDGERYDVVVMSVLRPEWEARR